MVEMLTDVVSEPERKTSMMIRTMTCASMSQIKLLLSHFPLLVMGYPLFISDRQNGPTYVINHAFNATTLFYVFRRLTFHSFVGYYSIFAQPVATPLVGVRYSSTQALRAKWSPTRGVATKLGTPAQVHRRRRLRRQRVARRRLLRLSELGRHPR